MNGQWSLYDTTTGHFVGRTFACPEEDLQANTPAGHSALEGRHDHLSRKVDLASGLVIDYQPSAPGPDHEWHEPTKRWQLSAGAQAKAAANAAAGARIAELVANQHDVVRKAVLGDAAALAQLQAIDKEITGLRAAF